MIDYQQIIEELDDNKVKQLLDHLNIPYEDRGSYILMPTVCHHADTDEASWKLYYYKNSHIFQCYTEDGPQTIFTFLKNYYTTRDIVYACLASALAESPISLKSFTTTLIASFTVPT